MLLSKILPFFLDMKRFSFLYFLQFLSIACFAQFQDDFSGDLSNWQGDIASFIIEDEQLELNATVAGESKLLTQVNLPDSLFWEFYFKMNFNPSNNNNLRVYLQADDEDLPYSEGYFLQIGENLSDDAVQLWRNDGGIETQLATATLGAVSNSPEVKLRIERVPILAQPINFLAFDQNIRLEILIISCSMMWSSQNYCPILNLLF